MSTNMERLCRNVWLARAEGRLLRDDTRLSQMLWVAGAEDVAIRETYDPEMDKRVAWLREIITEMREQRPQREPRACMALEDMVAWMLWGHTRVPCGKDLAAGVS